MYNFSDIVILAGGYGERLWPASKPDFPKQFLSISRGLSFLQSSVKRALFLKPEGKILIVTRKDILDEVINQCSKLSDHLDSWEKEKLFNDLIVIAEPSARHTTAAILLSTYCLSKEKDHNILVLTSDHIISPVENFNEDCSVASKASAEGNFVCFAIPPYTPSVSYGYIKQGSPLDSSGKLFKIEHFKEKPDFETAVKYLQTGKYFWNSGMFGFMASTLREELSIYSPEVTESFRCFNDFEEPSLSVSNSIHYIDKWEPMEKAYESVPKIAIDIAVAEKTKKAAVVKSSFKWDDVGSWDSFEKNYTCSDSNSVEVSSENNFVYSDIPVALCGVKDLIVVIKNGKALVLKKGESALVREAANKMKENE